MRDALDNALENPAVTVAAFGIVQRAEAQCIQNRNRPRAHRKDIAQDAADARGGSLKRLDETRVIVRFDIKSDRVSVPDVDDTGVLARADQQSAAPRGRLLPM